MNASGGGEVAAMNVDCVGETCPVPPVETRKALRQAREGDMQFSKSRAQFALSAPKSTFRPNNLSRDGGQVQLFGTKENLDTIET